MRRLAHRLLLLAGMTLAPTVAFAQASLAGLVQDTSGGVLPGVSVEAASPALIEKVRTTTTDANGRYSIPDLRPGAYTITFTLSGFSTFRREGVELTGTAVVTINADMRVGTLEETITVTGETPIVDVQSTTRQAVIDQEVLAAIPNARNPFTTGVLIPGVRRGGTNVPDVGGSVVQEVASLEFNGSRQSDQRMMVNGVALSTMIGGGWGGGAVPNATGMAEFAIDVSGVDAQAATGGVRINFIPRDGGNRLSGTVFGGFTTENFASDNFTGSDVQARGLTAAPQIKGNGDFNPGVGGPFVRDKVWFFVSGRYLYADNYVPGMFHNANANNVNAFRYVSTGEQAIIHQDQTMYQARVTWQANSKNKIGFTYDHEALCSCPNQISATVAPEASVDRRFPLQRFIQMDWNSPVSNRLLLEASAIHRVERWGGMHLQTGKGDNIDAIAPGMVPVIDNPSLATGASLNYRAFATARRWHVQQLLELEHPLPGRSVLHHGFAQLQGRFQQRLRPSREHQLHRPDDAVLLQLRERCADAAHLPDYAADGRGERGSRPRALCAGQVDCGPMDARRWRSLRPLQEQLPAAGDCANGPGAESQRQLRSNRELLVA